MMSKNGRIQGRSACRVLDLDEMQEPFFRKVLQDLEHLVSLESVSYLHPSKQWEYPWAMEQSCLTAGSRVLDAGCGASIFPIYLAHEAFRVSAVDLNPPAGLDERHGVRVNYAVGDMTRLPWKNDVFDAVFCISVIEHLDVMNMPAALQEIRRVLKENGRLLLTTDFFADRNAKLRYEGPGEAFDVDWNFFDPKMLEEVVLNAPGFTVCGSVSIDVDWTSVRRQMRRFHGYPYTSVGVALSKTPDGPDSVTGR
ncbi:MAG: class I SAM-dependent methyltransferase [Desulfobacterales bacterium]